MLSIPDHVHVTTGPRGGSVLLDERSGRCYAMNGVANELWRAWDQTGDFDAALIAVARRNPVYATERFSTDARQLADTLLAKGLLVAGPRSERVAQEVRHREPRAKRGFRVAAVFAFPITLLLVLLPFRVTVRVLSWSRRRWCRREVTAEQALAAYTAFDKAARFHPGRVACLELSLGAVVTLALSRRYLSLVIGVADDPCRFHAWVETPDGPMTYPSQVDFAQFRPIFAA